MQEFTNEVIEIDQLPKYQETKLNPPHPNYWKVILFNIISTLISLAIISTTLILLVDEEVPFIGYLIGSFIVFAILLILLYRASFKKRGFALREKDIIYKSGIIAETTSIIPLNRIQHVALNEGMFSRMFRLATLQIYTAGGSSGHINIAGIPIEEAQAIKEALLKKLDLMEHSITE